MRIRTASAWIIAASCLASASAGAADALPPEVMATLGASGLPLGSFGVYARPIDGDASAALVALNAEQPFLLASTTKVVTALAALDLLGPTHRWQTQAFSATPVVNGRLHGDLVIVGGNAGLTPAELGRWFKQMRAQGLDEVTGRIVLDRLSLLHELHPAQLATTAAERSPGAPLDARTYNQGALVVGVQPAAGRHATVTLTPRPVGVTVLNDVVMNGDACNAWAQWRTPQETRGGPPQLWVRGRWDASCGKRDIAFVRSPPSARLAPSTALLVAQAAPVSTPRLVATLWAAAGGKLRGTVVETERGLTGPGWRQPPPWTSEVLIPLPDVVREMNKTSNNLAARSLMLSLSTSASTAPKSALREAQERVQGWLRAQGLNDGDIRIDQGSGQSRLERGKPRAMVQLLCNAWRARGSKAFLDSLPISGVDGTLAHRMLHGTATGQAYLKTGTLSDTRALAGYVRAKSGKVYAVAAIVNNPNAARATPALDAFIEWVAKNG